MPLMLRFGYGDELGVWNFHFYGLAHFQHGIGKPNGALSTGSPHPCN